MLKGLFRQATFLEPDLEAWSLETWAWLMTHLGGMERLAMTPLVLATTDFFPRTETEGEARGAFLFDRVKTLMGMQAWDCELEPRKRREANAQVGEFWFLRSKGGPNGAFQARDEKVVISYAADLIARPRQLIPTFAHELAHYLLATVDAPLPGGDEAHELVTEMAVAYAGFGAFAANTAFDFEQHGDAFGQGWSAQRNGYLSERSWAFALAVFLVLKGQRTESAGVLKPSVADLLKKAERYLASHPKLLEPLRRIA